MTMNRDNQKENVLRLLNGAYGLLEEVVVRKTWINDLERISVALTCIKLAVRKAHINDFGYADVLATEEYTLRNKRVVFLTMKFCECESMSFDDTRKLGNTFVFLEDDDQKVRDLPPVYNIGNRAIGQIYVDGQEGYSEKIAIEHTIESIAYRWYSCCKKMLRNLKEVGYIAPTTNTSKKKKRR